MRLLNTFHRRYGRISLPGLALLVALVAACSGAAERPLAVEPPGGAELVAAQPSAVCYQRSPVEVASLNRWQSVQSFANTETTLVGIDNGTQVRVPNPSGSGLIENRSKPEAPATTTATWSALPETICVGDSAEIRLHVDLSRPGGVGELSNMGFWQTYDQPVTNFLGDYDLRDAARGMLLAPRELVYSQVETTGDTTFKLTVDPPAAGTQPQPFRVVFWAHVGSGPFFQVVLSWRYTPGAATAEVRDPVILIPGVTGSQLVAVTDHHNLWPPEGPGASRGLSNKGAIASDFTRLSLNPVTGPHEEIIATDVIRTDGSDVYYASLIDYLTKEGGYREYDVAKDPARRTAAGCDVAQTNRSLFVFAYDWRRDNADTAKLLADYVSCVEKLRPGKPIAIVAHSMGGLVARRYIIDHPGKVNRLITIASPFLGSPKPLYQMLRGSTGLTWSDAATEALFSTELKEMLAYYPGVHQLMASKAYFDLGGRPFQTLSPNGATAVKPNVLDYAGLMGANGYVAKAFPGKSYNGMNPAESNQAFHSYSAGGNAQDDWSHDTTKVRYFHIVGVQASGDTPLVLQETSVGFDNSREFQTFGPGDGTVPRLSAERKQEGGANYNAPNAVVRVMTSGDDSKLEHTGLASNPEVQKQVLDWLQ